MTLNLPVKAAIRQHSKNLRGLLVAEDFSGLHTGLIDVNTEHHIFHLRHRLRETYDGGQVSSYHRYTVGGTTFPLEHKHYILYIILNTEN